MTLSIFALVWVASAILVQPLLHRYVDKEDRVGLTFFAPITLFVGFPAAWVGRTIYRRREKQSAA
jgi:hypothetical protein